MLNQSGVQMSDQDKHQEIMDAIKEINKKLNPIYETYQVWLHVGRWGKAIIYTIAGILAAIVSWYQIWKEIFKK